MRGRARRYSPIRIKSADRRDVERRLSGGRGRRRDHCGERQSTGERPNSPKGYERRTEKMGGAGPQGQQHSLSRC